MSRSGSAHNSCKLNQLETEKTTSEQRKQCFRNGGDYPTFEVIGRSPKNKKYLQITTPVKRAE